MPEGSGEQGNMEKTGCKIIGGAPLTLMVRGLMMMMMMCALIHVYNSYANSELHSVRKYKPP